MKVYEFSGVHDFERIGQYRTRNDGTNRDYDVRYIVGRNGEAISILEEFDPITGHIHLVVWQIDYDPAQRTAMIYG